MCIYCGTNYYRKIWTEHFGSIPKDKTGRSHEIHHIDGNHQNNNITNLTCISIQEHYDIHKSQQDYGACSAILIRMHKDPILLSTLLKEVSRQKVLAGKHNFQTLTPEKRIENAKNAARIQLEAGKNVLVGPNNNNRLKELGIHPLVGGEASKKGVRSQLKNGTHASQRVYCCDLCNKTIKGSANFKRHTNYCQTL
jgi:hypothetical protein